VNASAFALVKKNLRSQMSIDVIVPFASECEHRQRAFEWVSKRYAERHPDWRLIVGEAPTSPWCKARAVHDALQHSDTDVIIVADADVWVDELEPYVEIVTARARPWCTPHRRVIRFNEVGTAHIIDDGVHPVDIALMRGQLEQTPYTALLGGGLVILPRALYDACPLDPRFEGWGSEDWAWGFALCTIGGRRAQGDALIWHLWHPPQERMNRVIGSTESDALRERYQKAAGDVEATNALIEEGRQWLLTHSSSHPSSS